MQYRMYAGMNFLIIQANIFELLILKYVIKFAVCPSNNDIIDEIQDVWVVDAINADLFNLLRRLDLDPTSDHINMFDNFMPSTRTINLGIISLHFLSTGKSPLNFQKIYYNCNIKTTYTTNFIEDFKNDNLLPRSTFLIKSKPYIDGNK